LRVALPGRHNIVNAAGAATAAWALNVNEAAIRQALGRMKTVGRRLEIKGEIGGVRVIDDYAHHPREVAASLSGARALTDHDGKGRLGVIFQPHRFTRLAALMDDFCRCFGDADRIFLLPVYAASEAPIPGADHTVLAEKIRLAGGPTVEMVSGLDEAVEQAAIWSRSGDAVVTQGAGTVTLAADKLLARLKLR
jgi:UDP-N-acetylmuramate--alanine ligase